MATSRPRQHTYELLLCYEAAEFPARRETPPLSQNQCQWQHITGLTSPATIDITPRPWLGICGMLTFARACTAAGGVLYMDTIAHGGTDWKAACWKRFADVVCDSVRALE